VRAGVVLWFRREEGGEARPGPALPPGRVCGPPVICSGKAGVKIALSLKSSKADAQIHLSCCI